MKATGAEILEFYNEWPMVENFYYDEMEGGLQITDGDTGESLLDPTAKYELSDVYGIAWQGPAGEEPREDRHYSFEYQFKKWKKNKTHETVTVIVPKISLAAFREICRQEGWKVS